MDIEGSFLLPLLLLVVVVVVVVVSSQRFQGFINKYAADTFSRVNFLTFSDTSR